MASQSRPQSVIARSMATRQSRQMLNGDVEGEPPASGQRWATRHPDPGAGQDGGEAMLAIPQLHLLDLQMTPWVPAGIAQRFVDGGADMLAGIRARASETCFRLGFDVPYLLPDPGNLGHHRRHIHQPPRAMAPTEGRWLAKVNPLLHQQPGGPSRTTAGCRQEPLEPRTTALDFGCNLSRRSVRKDHGPQNLDPASSHNLEHPENPRQTPQRRLA